jgi:hypothetical protein
VLESSKIYRCIRISKSVLKCEREERIILPRIIPGRPGKVVTGEGDFPPVDENAVPPRVSCKSEGLLIQHEVK